MDDAKREINRLNKEGVTSMTECLLCEKAMTPTPSWKSLLALDKETYICQDCSKKFKRADNKEEDTTLDAIDFTFCV